MASTPDGKSALGVRQEGVLKIWGGKRESNPQPSEPQSGALPVELFPPPRLIIATVVRGCRSWVGEGRTGLRDLKESLSRGLRFIFANLRMRRGMRRASPRLGRPRRPSPQSPSLPVLLLAAADPDVLESEGAEANR